MLVEGGIDAWCYGCAVGVGLSLRQWSHEQNACQANFELDATVLVEVVIPDILCVKVNISSRDNWEVRTIVR